MATKEKEILQILDNKTSGLSTTELANRLKISRLTVTKYLSILHAKGEISYKNVGMAKLWTVSGNNRKKKILIVDDEENILRLIGIIMRLERYDVISARDGLEALEKVNSSKPDLVILDLMLPKLSGEEVFQRIRLNNETKNIPVLMLTAKRELEDRMKGIKLGSDDYLTKPFNPAELKERVKNLLRNPLSERNSVTGLPNISRFMSEIKGKQNILILLITIKNLDEYGNNYGIQRKNESLKLISQVFLNNIPDNLLCQMDDHKFIAAIDSSKEKEEINRIKRDFKETIPFFYDEDINNMDVSEKNLIIRKSSGKTLVLPVLSLNIKVLKEGKKALKNF